MYNYCARILTKEGGVMDFYTGEYEDMSEVINIFRKTVGTEFMESFKKEVQRNGFQVQHYDKVARVRNIVKVFQEKGRGFLVYYQGSDREAWWNFSSNGINEMLRNEEGLLPIVVLGRKKEGKMTYYFFRIVKEIDGEKKRCICNLDKGKPICDCKGCLQAIGLEDGLDADKSEDGQEYCFEEIGKLFKVAVNSCERKVEYATD